MRNLVLGILAHVDAGKTTLAEAILYKTGAIRSVGRVDHGNTALDTDAIERERGITIFAGQAIFEINDVHVTLLDTPGHVDFSAETERTLQVLDHAILVISANDGVQVHTRTLWRLLEHYAVPTTIFVSKMDFARRTKGDILEELKAELSGGCVGFCAGKDEIAEQVAECDEKLMEKYFECGTLDDEDIRSAVNERKIFPCCFGSGLKLDGVEELLDGIVKYASFDDYPADFGAKVFKISHDEQGNRLAHMKITGGSMKVKSMLGEEKINQIRLYSGAKYVTADEVTAGQICAVTGTENAFAGQGFGYEKTSEPPVLEPVMSYRIVLPEECDAKTMMPKLKMLEEEDPLLRIVWNASLQEIYVSLMGEVQIQVIKRLIAQRFGVDVSIDSGRVLYKETIADTVEGVGHYEPLRHYAEAHIIIEPMPRGSGITISTSCSEDFLDRNWQRLIMTNLAEKQHLGVLTGSALTDVKYILAAGRAHLKHTEGGDFRQATYRAVRQGLMQAKSILLEPFYAFRLEIPDEQIGRAINDIHMRNGEFDTPLSKNGTTVIIGRAPVSTMNGYALDVSAYTGGRGSLSCTPCGYFECHNAAQVIESIAYEPESDLENTPDSVFCSHGAGFNVKWNEVTQYMHLESSLKKK